jgi:hypothetical protein
MTIPMTATKGMSYAGKRLIAGDDFAAKTPRDAKLLVAIRKAEYRTAAFATAPVLKAQTQLPEAPAAAGGNEETSEISTLRAEYREVVGRGPFNGWDAETLREKIAAKKAEVTE